MNNEKFIISFDGDTANRLTQMGFQEIMSDGQKTTFLNDKKLHFSDMEKMKLSYSNIMHL